MAVIEINPFRVGLLIDTKLFAAGIGIEPELSSEINVNTTQHLGRLSVQQLVVDDFPRTLKSSFVSNERSCSGCNRSSANARTSSQQRTQRQEQEENNSAHSHSRCNLIRQRCKCTGCRN